MTKLGKEANSICFLCSRAIKAGGRISTKVPPPTRRPLLMNYFFHSGILRLSRCGPVKRQELNALHFCLKHTLRFSNFTIVPGKIKRALSTCRCVQWAFMSYLITGKLFFEWAEVWAESGQTIGLDDFHHNTMTRQQRLCLKSLSRCWAPTLYCGLQACELQ